MDDSALLIDADQGFLKVDTQLPPHELPEGTAADAVNKRFEDGRAWPRYGFLSEAWGTLPIGAGNLVGGGATYVNFLFNQVVNVGQIYRLVLGNHDATATCGGVQISSVAFQLPDNSYLFTATGPVLTLRGTIITGSVTAKLYYGFRPRGFSRFIDPDGFDNLVVLTDEWRTGAAQDGGIGRAYRVISGNLPIEIPLNGHDIYGEARLVPCFNGLLLLRQDAERHYLQAADFNTSTNVITFHVAPNWKTGELVYFFAFPNSYVLGTSPPNPQTQYYIQMTGATTGKLFGDPAFSIAIDFAGGANGSFYLERRAAQPGFYGNGAPPLLMQTDGSGATVWQIGFKAVPAVVFATAFSATTKVLSVPNHRLIPGDQLIYTHTTLATETFYALPVSPDGILLYASALLALAGGTTNAQTPSPAFTAGDFITKGGASVLAMPPLREGVYTEVNRLMGINQRNTLAISDPLDPLHFTPQLSTVTASLGEGDSLTGIVPMSKDRLVLAKETKLLQFLGISQATSSWQITNLTKEYGWIAPLAMIPVGKDAWGLSRKGITSVFGSETGEILGLADPISRPMKKYIDMIDWNHAGQACAATWNNRAFWALPLKGQAAGSIQNNGILVYNILNQGWEGLWNGPTLLVYCFARAKVYGQERLCFVNYNGQVSYFDEVAFTDNGSPIADSLTTRTYTGKDPRAKQKPKLWLVANLVWDTYAPKLTVNALASGYNEVQNLAAALQYDKTQYLVSGKSPYNPAAPANFNDPYRQDYAQSIGELLAGPLDVHQNVSENFRMRVNDWGVQIQILNANGSARLVSVTVKAAPTLQVSSRQA